MLDIKLAKKRDVPFSIYDIDIFSATDHDLTEISLKMGLNLSLQEMKDVRSYFQSKNRLPTDVELQSIAQAWSEHCCYKSSKVFLRENIFNIKNDDVLSKGDAGVMNFDDEHAYCLRIESHNHPSAIEPYGGAATGIGGIVRDVLAMGAQPIALVDPLFFGPPDLKEVPSGTKLPKYLIKGVVGGIRDYGNRIGIPTIAGGLYFDNSYIGNCLVNVGCIGFLRKNNLLNNSVKGVGDVLILVGGKTGRDGIHGVNFASAGLHERSEDESRGAVQLGDPIMKEPTIHASLEASEKGLVSGIKDLGGGGLSCVVGEIALAGGCGATVNVDHVPLKEEGLAPWEIWVSESQERMMIAAPHENIIPILEIFDMWDVPAVVIGEVISEQKVTLYYMGELIYDLDLDFLTNGPEYCRPCARVEDFPTVPLKKPKLPENLEDALLTLLSDPNIASKDWVIRQYDHEVRGNTVIKPLQGDISHPGPADATVIKPLPNSFKGLAIAIGVNPWYAGADPLKGGKSAVDEACRNIVAVGGKPHALTDCLNFGNPEKPEKLYEFREALKGIGNMAKELGLAIPSGNVSFYNETAHGSVLPAPTILGVGIVEDIRKCVTTDFKDIGNPVYLVGETKDEMGSSALWRVYGGEGGHVPDSNSKILTANSDLVLSGIRSGIVRSCHDCSDGGLAVAVSEMCIGGNIGFAGDLSGILSPEIELFSESNSRFIVEINSDKEEQWIKLAGSSAKKIGSLKGDRILFNNFIDISVESAKNAWSTPLWEIMG